MTIVSDHWTSGTTPAGETVRVLHHEPERPPRGRLVWAHGGSWQRGSAVQWAPVTRRLAARTGWAVSSVDYHLAPDHPFPAAVCDVLDVLDGVGHPDEAGIPFAVGGDSAGGTIAAVAALARRDRGQRIPRQFLAYPPLDPGCERPSYHQDPAEFPHPVDLRRAWQLWLTGARGAHGAHEDLYHSPLGAPSLRGLAPVFLTVGDLDPVHDDVAEYAGRLCVDEVPTTFSVLPGTAHADILSPYSSVLADLVRALNEVADESGGTDPDDERSRQ